MKKILIVVLTLVSLQANCQSEKMPSWLIGSWQNVKNGSIEEWKGSDNMLSGRVYKLNEKDTVILEKLRIEQKEGKLYYIADVAHNPAPVLFEIYNASQDYFICQNPEHDFPKQIEYSYKDELLTVIISDGDMKNMGFQFKKLE